ncbi:MAG: diaminopimelate epimerase [Candidatus Omnitrophica bacterium]|nr:diaminopimelate epimerase [Candidatus Omnitrophota bacterium]
MKIIHFHKMVASGNDFIVIDNRRKAVKDAVKLARELCTLHTAVGADGILLIENSRKAAFKMRIINSDGSEAEACGNGFRCIALYARKILKLPSTFQFESLSGLIDAKVMAKDCVRVRLIQPHDLRLRRKLMVSGQRLDYSFINTGVPHTVILVKQLQKINVAQLGKAIREHKDFKPKGTNVNFVQVRSTHGVDVRTFERGVEAETLACGTGSTASAVVSALLGLTKPPVKVKTRGGETLTIDFKLKNTQPADVTLQGQARFVFAGQLNF